MTHIKREEVAEQIVIDYANFSGREDTNRALFRKRTLDCLTAFEESVRKERDGELREKIEGIGMEKRRQALDELTQMGQIQDSLTRTQDTQKDVHRPT